MAYDWNNLGTGLLNTGLGIYGANAGVNAANNMVGYAEGSDAQRRAAYNAYAGSLAGLAPSVEAGFAMRPATARTGFATSSVDPTTGQVGYTLDPRAQGLLGKYMTGAQSAVDLAGDMNPETMAAKRFAQQQALLAPSRSAQDTKLMRDLAAKGLLGGATFDGSTTGAAQNPFMAALQGARTQADSRAAYDSLSEGEKYLDRLMGRSQGMLGLATGVDEQGRKALSTAGDWTDRFTRNASAKTNATVDLFGRAYGAQRDAAYSDPAAARILASQAGAEKANADRTGGFIRGGLDVLNTAGGIGGILKNLGGIGSGMLGGGYSPSWYETSMFDDWGGFYG